MNTINSASKDQLASSQASVYADLEFGVDSTDKILGSESSELHNVDDANRAAEQKQRLVRGDTSGDLDGSKGILGRVMAYKCRCRFESPLNLSCILLAASIFELVCHKHPIKIFFHLSSFRC